ncbi:hypothetical protein B4168_4103 [Anoxybacillus flavithermus]|nr:hypothetical protein B4168_4103 [Anoxybacillus flavithermus]
MPQRFGFWHFGWRKQAAYNKTKNRKIYMNSGKGNFYSEKR